MSRRKTRKNAETFGYSSSDQAVAKDLGPHSRVVEVSLPWIKKYPQGRSNYAHMMYGGEGGIEISLVKSRVYVGGSEYEDLEPAWFLMIRDEIMAVIPNMPLAEAIEQTPELLAMSLLDKILVMPEMHGVTLRQFFKTDD